MNEEHHKRLVETMYSINDFPLLDDYGSIIFGYNIRGSWRIFRHVAKTATANVWLWVSEREIASYPKDVEVPTFEEFATLMLHEVAHGWCYFMRGDSVSGNYLDGINEDKICWEVSKLVCDRLQIIYHEELAKLLYEYYLLSTAGDVEGMARMDRILPTHSRWPT